MKKKGIIIAIIAVVVLAFIGMIYASTTLKEKEKNEDDHLVIVSYDELQQKVDNKETFILLISQTDCPHCLAYKPILKEVLVDYDLYAYEIQLDTLSDDEISKLNNIANTSGTPVTTFIINGEEKNTSSRLVGEAQRDRIISRFKAMGFIE